MHLFMNSRHSSSRFKRDLRIYLPGSLDLSDVFDDICRVDINTRTIGEST